MAENAGGEQRRRGLGRRFKPGQSGNPAGKPKGVRHRATVIAEQLFDGEAKALTRKAIELALAGDTVALRLCLDRILPPRRDRPVHFSIPAMRTAADATAAMASITSALASGQLTPREAAELSNVIEAWLRAIENTETERRLSELEKQTNNNAP